MLFFQIVALILAKLNFENCVLDDFTGFWFAGPMIVVSLAIGERPSCITPGERSFAFVDARVC